MLISKQYDRCREGGGGDAERLADLVLPDLFSCRY